MNGNFLRCIFCGHADGDTGVAFRGWIGEGAGVGTGVGVGEGWPKEPGFWFCKAPLCVLEIPRFPLPALRAAMMASPWDGTVRETFCAMGTVWLGMVVAITTAMEAA